MRQGVLASLTKSPDTLEEEFGWLETDLRLGNQAFDGRSRLLESLKRTTLPEIIRTYETMVMGPGGTRALIQIQGSRFDDFGWARKTGAEQVAEPVDFHRLMGVQRYRGL